MEERERGQASKEPKNPDCNGNEIGEKKPHCTTTSLVFVGAFLSSNPPMGETGGTGGFAESLKLECAHDRITAQAHVVLFGQYLQSVD
jgi:hypothetical protein